MVSNATTRAVVFLTSKFKGFSPRAEAPFAFLPVFFFFSGDLCGLCAPWGAWMTLVACFGELHGLNLSFCILLLLLLLILCILLLRVGPLHRLKEEEIELGLFEVLGALELGGGGVHSYEKALIGWFFSWSRDQVTMYRASRSLERAPDPPHQANTTDTWLAFKCLGSSDCDLRLDRDEITTGYVSQSVDSGLLRHASRIGAVCHDVDTSGIHTGVGTVSIVMGGYHTTPPNVQNKRRTLSSTELQGELSGDIGSLTEMETLDLSYNVNLTGPLPQSIGSLTNLKRLVLAGCSFNGPIPDLGNLQNLSTLSLSSNQFSGQIPPSIGRLSSLYVLDITDNRLTGSIPVSPGLDMLINCRHFHCGKNQLSGSIPEGLFRPKMQIIHVLFDNNNLSGTIPSSLGLVKTLEVVRLDRNSITGHVPNNINSLTNLRELHLSNNKLNGFLPNLTGLELLSYVDLSNNSFDPSDAPPWFSTLTSLTTIVMDNARIQNSLTHDLFTQSQIQIVQLRNNFLNGTVDLRTDYGSKLRLVDLRNNKIEDVRGGGEQK
ncbi:hypothetical protein Taro_025868 [Colocasia esculenta]|uniref:Uncharacterized protein n=1 Tax=Colocasia esculenta TaxID=4460 RepID=A0A843VHU6_COLES|nr:hypothetical protein [Colocasia esculenta]